MLEAVRGMVPQAGITLDNTWATSKWPFDDALTGEGNGGTPGATGGWIKIQEFTGWSIQVAWGGTPTGNPTIEVSDDGITAELLATGPALGGGAGHWMFERTNYSGASYVRLNFATVGSTGPLTKAVFKGQRANVGQL